MKNLQEKTQQKDKFFTCQISMLTNAMPRITIGELTNQLEAKELQNAINHFSESPTLKLPASSSVCCARFSICDNACAS